MMKKRKKNTIDYVQTADVLKSAAHPERLAIMHYLWEIGCKPTNVKVIYESLGLEQSSVSRHLGILKRCGLLKKSGSGNNTCYFLDTENPITVSMVNCLNHNND